MMQVVLVVAQGPSTGLLATSLGSLQAAAAARENGVLELVEDLLALATSSAVVAEKMLRQALLLPVLLLLPTAVPVQPRPQRPPEIALTAGAAVLLAVAATAPVLIVVVTMVAVRAGMAATPLVGALSSEAQWAAAATVLRLWHHGLLLSLAASHSPQAVAALTLRPYRATVILPLASRPAVCAYAQVRAPVVETAAGEAEAAQPMEAQQRLCYPRVDDPAALQIPQPG